MLKGGRYKIVLIDKLYDKAKDTQNCPYTHIFIMHQISLERNIKSWTFIFGLENLSSSVALSLPRRQRTKTDISVFIYPRHPVR